MNMRVSTFACELCGAVHTAGESPFVLRHFSCGALSPEANDDCVSRITLQANQTQNLERRAFAQGIIRVLNVQRNM